MSRLTAWQRDAAFATAAIACSFAVASPAALANAKDDAALKAAASASGKPAGKLALKDRSRVVLEHSNKTLDVSKVMADDGSVYQVALDEQGKSVNLADAQSADAAKGKGKYGKLDASLHAKVEGASAGDKLPVSIWLAAGTPSLDRSKGVHALLSDVQTYYSTRRQHIKGVLKKMGAAMDEPLYAPALFARLTKGQINQLEREGDVAALYTNATYTKFADDASTTTRAYSTWALGNLGFSTSARPVVHEDDGVSDANVNLNNARHPVNFFCASVNALCPSSKNVGGHATSVAGAIASTHPQHRGLAPNVQQILSANSQNFSDSQLVLANEWARGNGGDPTNMSWGTTCPNGGQTFMSRYVDWATKNLAQTFTISSGNDHPACPGNFNVSQPGGAWSVITVGAYGDGDTGSWGNDTQSGFSRHIDPSTGQMKPEVESVGQGLCLTDAPNSITCGHAGTSFSSPLVAGQVSLGLARQPGLNTWPETNKAAVLASATQDIVAGTNVDGLGGVNVYQSDETYRTGRWGTGSLNSGSFDANGFAFRTFSVPAAGAYKMAFAYDSYSTGGSGTDVLGVDLDMSVLNSAGTVLCSSVSSFNAWERCQFTAAAAGTYTLRIRRFNTPVAGWPGTFYGFALATTASPFMCNFPARTFPAAGGTLSYATDSGPTFFDSYAGFAGERTGREAVLVYNNTAPKTLTVTKTNAAQSIHAIQVTCGSHTLTPTIKANGTSSVTIPNAAAGTYYFIVDAPTGVVGSGTATLTVS